MSMSAEMNRKYTLAMRRNLQGGGEGGCRGSGVQREGVLGWGRVGGRPVAVAGGVWGGGRVPGAGRRTHCSNSDRGTKDSAVYLDVEMVLSQNGLAGVSLMCAVRCSPPGGPGLACAGVGDGGSSSGVRGDAVPTRGGCAADPSAAVAGASAIVAWVRVARSGRRRAAPRQTGGRWGRVETRARPPLPRKHN